MTNGKTRPHKLSMAMRAILDARGIDLVKMQIDVYTKAMAAFDSHRGDNEKSDAGSSYLGICNQAISTLAKYAYPTMTAIKLEDLDNSVNDKIIDAVAIRQRILNDPFAKNAIAAINSEQIGLPVLPVSKVETNEG